VLCAGIIVASAATADAWTPKILTDPDAPPLPDFSYAGYRFSEEPLPKLKPTMNVTDFGARPNDGKDDTEAIRKAIAAAAKRQGAQVIGFPTGRLIVREIVYIEHSNVVLQGAGSGEGGTELHVPRPMADMELPQAMQRTRRYMVENDKRVGGELFSIFSWSGGVIWTRGGDRVDRFKTLPLVAGKRGGHTVKVDGDAGSIKPGAVGRIEWRNTEGEDSTFLRHVFGEQPLRFGKRLHEDPKRPLVRQIATVVSVDGDTLTLKAPLLHDIRPTWSVTIKPIRRLEEVGIEGFRITFPETAYRGHHREAGYNAIYMTGLVHGWVRDVEIKHADSGILSGGCANVTMQHVAVRGRGGHYTVHIGGCNDMLVRDFDLTAPAIHNPSVNTFAVRNVYSRGRVEHVRFDQHSGANHMNLFDDIEASGNPRHLFRHGGAGYWRPTHGVQNTFWNIRLNLPVEQAVTIGGINDGPHARFIGLRANVPLKLDYGPDVYVEGLNRGGVAVPSLFDYQLKKRLNSD